VDPKSFFTRIVAPALQYMADAPGINIRVTDAARVLMMTIAGQESAWKYRIQIGGPAHSYWQFEKMGGVAEVLQKCPKQLAVVCGEVECPAAVNEVYIVMAGNDLLAACMARLLLWQDPAALPAVGDKEAAWAYYLRNWRPGAPHRASWDGLYDQALAAIGAKP